MPKSQILKILNPCLALLLVFILLSALLPAVFPFPLHRGAGILFAAGIGLHIVLNWPWIRSNLFKR
ncbi:MAG: hypothetical protein JW929_10485 [Anaerolineales bacterium]|nr:hypothetical protein [Anaerolineales bacterium]